MEQVVDQQLVAPLPIQVQSQQPFTGLNFGAGKIEDHHRVGNDNLRNPPDFQSGKNGIDFYLIHKNGLPIQTAVMLSRMIKKVNATRRG